MARHDRRSSQAQVKKPRLLTKKLRNPGCLQKSYSRIERIESARRQGRPQSHSGRLYKTEKAESEKQSKQTEKRSEANPRISAAW